MTTLEAGKVDLLGIGGGQSGQEFEAVVTKRELGADGVVLLTLERADGLPLPGWQPGAHIDVVINEDMIRQYSLCSDPQDSARYQIGVLLEEAGRGGSKYIFEHGEVGGTFLIRGPRNHFRLVDVDEYVLIAGGIGVTPLYAMIHSLERQHKKWKLYYAGRSAETMLFRRALEGFAGKVEFVVKGQQKRLDVEAIVSGLAGTEAVYCCGPDKLMDAVEAAGQAAAMSGMVHLERFTPVEIDESTNRPFVLELERSNLMLQVPVDKSTMEVMNDAGIYVPTSCAAGTCGSCEVAVLEGVPEHRDAVLTDEEREENFCMMVCVSRAKSSRIVLDI